MIVWLIVAIVAAIGEVLTTGLFLATASVAAIATAIIAVFIPFVVVQVVLFGLLALLGILVIRPLLVQQLGLSPLVHLTGEIPQPRMMGKRAVVTVQVDPHSGQVRIGHGEFWSARAFDAESVIPVGSPVEIMLVDGLTALVEPVEPERTAQPSLSVQSNDKGAS